MTLKESCIRIKNALLYKVGLRAPYSKIRIWSLRKMGFTVGRNVYLPADLVIAHNVVYNRGNLTIGDRVSIAPGVILILSSHSNFSKTSHAVTPRANSITIGKDAWIGAASVILNGTNIGEAAVVGAGSIVTHDVPSHTVVAGNPAKVIRTIDTHEQHTD